MCGQVLVLDEADRILDMGFRDQLTSILQYLPSSRQTLLFSATQTKSVKDLARLSLKKDVEFVAVRSTHTPGTLAEAQYGQSLAHRPSSRTLPAARVMQQVHAAKDQSAVPQSLEQSYMVVGVEDKLDCIFSFIKAHLKAKTVVFFATCSQVPNSPHERPGTCALLCPAPLTLLPCLI